jgi:hypothetical protein
LTGALDLLMNFPLLIRCKWIEYIFKKDPYYFRAQIWLFMPFMIYSLASEITITSLTDSYFAILNYYVVGMALNTVGCILLLIIEIWLPIVLTIFRWARAIARRNHKGNVLDDVLNNAETNKLFVEYCKIEYSVENVSCWSEIQTYKKSKTTPEFATEIYFKYFNGASSIMEVNVTSTEAKQIKNEIAQLNCTSTLFDKVESTIKGNLADTYTRFIFHPPYEAYCRQQETNLELIEGKRSNYTKRKTQNFSENK